MATLRSSSVSETSFKSQNPILCCLALIFIFLVLVHSTTDSTFNPSSMPSSRLSATQALVPRSSSSNMNFHPAGKGLSSHKSPSSSSSCSSSREFETGEHEVPSGPNPISN